MRQRLEGTERGSGGGAEQGGGSGGGAEQGGGSGGGAEVLVEEGRGGRDLKKNLLLGIDEAEGDRWV